MLCRHVSECVRPLKVMTVFMGAFLHLKRFLVIQNFIFELELCQPYLHLLSRTRSSKKIGLSD
jgi:hypothetical protein